MIGYDVKDNAEFIQSDVMSGTHGSVKLREYTSSIKEITDGVVTIFKKRCNPTLSIRRINICAMEVVPIDKIPTQVIQANLFEVVEEKTQVDEEEMKVQQALLEIKNRYGKECSNSCKR